MERVGDKAVNQGAIASWRETTKKPCSCLNQIPGLDAIGCKVCKVWWVDGQVRDRMIGEKSKGKGKK